MSHKVDTATVWVQILHTKLVGKYLPQIGMYFCITQKKIYNISILNASIVSNYINCRFAYILLTHYNGLFHLMTFVLWWILPFSFRKHWTGIHESRSEHQKFSCMHAFTSFHHSCMLPPFNLESFYLFFFCGCLNKNRCLSL